MKNKESTDWLTGAFPCCVVGARCAMCCWHPARMVCVGCGQRPCCQKTACSEDRSLRTHTPSALVCQAWQATRTRSSMLWRYIYLFRQISSEITHKRKHEVYVVFDKGHYIYLFSMFFSQSTTWSIYAGVADDPLLWWHTVSCCPLSLAHRTLTLTATSLIMPTPCVTSIFQPVLTPTQVDCLCWSCIRCVSIFGYIIYNFLLLPPSSSDRHPSSTGWLCSVQPRWWQWWWRLCCSLA